MTDKTINPCPFCVSEDVETLSASMLLDQHFVLCENCGATGPAVVGKEKAIHKWNRPWVRPLVKVRRSTNHFLLWVTFGGFCATGFLLGTLIHMVKTIPL